MTNFICLQSGHKGRTTGATGTDGEQELNWRITLKLSEILQSKGFVIQIVGADPVDAELKSDFDLFLSLHGDMDTAKQGGCIGSGDKSVDSSWKRSAEIRDAIESLYFKETGIINNPNKVTDNMTKYYMWSRLTAKTPCVLLEMGEVKDAHDSVILADTDMVATAIAKGVCKAFNVAYEPVVVIPPPVATVDVSELIKKVADLEKSQKSLTARVKELEGNIATNEEIIETSTKEKQVLEVAYQKALVDLEYYQPYKARYESALTTQVNKYTGWQLIKIGVAKLRSK